MKVYWNDMGEGIPSDAAKEVSLQEAKLIWSDEIHGVKGNFLGLIDDEDRTIQFYFDASIPDYVEDARHLRIVFLDFPQPKQNGSFTVTVTIGEVDSLIEKAFEVGADYRQFDNVKFQSW